MSGHPPSAGSGSGNTAPARSPDPASAASKHRKLLSARSISATQLARLHPGNAQHSQSHSDGTAGTGRTVASPVKLRLLGRSSAGDVLHTGRHRGGGDPPISAGSPETAAPAAPRMGQTSTQDMYMNADTGRSSSERSTTATESLVQHALYPPSSSSLPTSAVNSPLTSPQAGSAASPLRLPPPRSHSFRTLRSGQSDPTSPPQSAPRSDRVPVSPFRDAIEQRLPPKETMSRSSAPHTAQSIAGSDKQSFSQAGQPHSGSIPASLSTSALSSALASSKATSASMDSDGAASLPRNRTTSRSAGVDQLPRVLEGRKATSGIESATVHVESRSSVQSRPAEESPHAQAGSSSTVPAAAFSQSGTAGAEASASDSNTSSSVAATKRKKDSSSTSHSRGLHKASLSALGASSSTPPSQTSKELKAPILPCADVEASISAGTSIPWSIGVPYWSLAPCFGKLPSRPMRAHSATLVSLPSSITSLSQFPELTSSMGRLGPRLQLPAAASLWVFGGCDSKTCFRDTWKLDLESFEWKKSHLKAFRDLNEHYPPPLRAHSATFIPPFSSSSAGDNAMTPSTEGHLLLFGGGDGPSYFNDIYTLSLRTMTWCKPSLLGKITGQIPPPRRAHAAVYYEKKKWLVVFGGGNGSRALNDTWVLECKYWNEKGLNWRKVETRGKKPKLRGYRELKAVIEAIGADCACGRRHDESYRR